MDENPIAYKISRKNDLALSASDSSLLIVDCREVTALQKVAGECNDLAVGLRNVAACVGFGAHAVVSDDAKK